MMTQAVILAVIAILVSVVTLAFVERSQVRGRKSTMLLLVSIIQIAFATIAGGLIPAGAIATLTQSVFVAAAFVMLVLVLREEIALRRGIGGTR